jgi:hypothetical protein
MRTSFQIRYGCLEIIEKMIVVLRLIGSYWSGVCVRKLLGKNTSDKKGAQFTLINICNAGVPFKPGGDACQSIF